MVLAQILFLSHVIALLQRNRRFKTADRWKYRDMQDEEDREELAKEKRDGRRIF